MKKIFNHQIIKGETTSQIAEKYGISANELIEFHNSQVGLTQQFFGEEIPFHISSVFINPKEDNKEEKQEFSNFTHKARYRCEQFNTTKVEDNISFHCNTKKEYTLENEVSTNRVKVGLKEYLYKINPQNLSLAIEATKELNLKASRV